MKLSESQWKKPIIAIFSANAYQGRFRVITANSDQLATLSYISDGRSVKLTKEFRCIALDSPTQLVAIDTDRFVKQVKEPLGNLATMTVTGQVCAPKLIKLSLHLFNVLFHLSQRVALTLDTLFNQCDFFHRIVGLNAAMFAFVERTSSFFDFRESMSPNMLFHAAILNAVGKFLNECG